MEVVCGNALHRVPRVVQSLDNFFSCTNVKSIRIPRMTSIHTQLTQRPLLKIKQVLRAGWCELTSYGTCTVY